MLRDALRSLLGRPVTVQYLTRGGEMVPVAERYRGRIVYDRESCIGCLLCTRTCPSGAITSTEAKKVAFNIARCLFCGQCMGICPKDAVSFSSDPEIVVHDKEELLVQ